MITRLFSQLDEWRRLPNYQLERRADIFFAIYLPLIFEEVFSCNVIDILPEFPIRIGTIYPSVPINKSYKIDYIVYADNSRAFLVELKTDNSSIRESQIKYYLKTIELGYRSLLDGLLEIYQASSYKSKYECLLQRLVNNGSLKKIGNGYKTLDAFSIYKDPIFIKPTAKEGDIGHILTFNQIAKILEKESDPFTHRFIKSLQDWSITV